MDLIATELRWDRMKVFLIVFLMWAAMYLPGIGGRELRGEEGRRMQPAVTMLKTGNWLVPEIAGRSYYQKPPMINWLVAGSFLLTGEQSEGAARLPSAVFFLALAALLVWFPGDWPRIEARLIAAVLFLTTFTITEKGRQIEIEAVYIALTSMAIFTWLALWANERSRWLLWLVPSVFLVCGMLTKGPPMLLFYYAPVLGVLAYSRRLRALVLLPHVVSVILFLGIPAVWAHFASAQAAREGIAAGLGGDDEIAMRLTSFVLGWSGWVENIVKSFTHLLPWGLFLPLLWRRDFLAQVPPERLPLLKGARLGMVLSFLAITFIPGNQARYMLPVLGLMCVLIGWVLGETAELPDRGKLWRTGLLLGFVAACVMAAAGIVRVGPSLWAVVALCATAFLALVLFQERLRFQTPTRLALLSAMLGVVLMLQFPLFALPLMCRNEKCRPIGARVSSLVPADQTIHLFDPGYQLFLFYIREPKQYLREVRQIDETVRYLLVRADAYERLKDEPTLAAREPKTLYDFAGKTYNFRLLEMAALPRQ